MIDRGTNDQPGTVPPYRHDLDAICTLMNAAFTAKELNRFCYYRKDFHPICANFAPTHGLADMIDIVIEYCEKRALLTKLVTEIEHYNPRQFDRFRPRLGPPWSLQQPSETRGSDELTLELRIKSSNFPFQDPYYSLSERDRELDSVLEVLSQKERRPIVLISGLGGIGKTSLAAELARRCATDPNTPFRTITWDSAKQELLMGGEIVQIRKAALALSDLVDSLGCQILGPDFVHQPERDKEPSLKSVLKTEPCLIVVDNLETMDNARQIMLRLQELLGTSRALVTSREAVAGDYFPVYLHGFPEDDSIAFLRREGQEHNAPDIAGADRHKLIEIHRAAEGMPLAMKLIVGQSQILGLDATLHRLRQGRGDIYFFIFLQSWQQLTTPAKKLLLYMGPTKGLVGREELKLALKATESQLDEAIDELVRLSLLNAHALPEIGERGYSLHQLTRNFAVNDLPAHWRREGLI